MCSKPDEVDRDVRHGQVTQDHDDDDDVCMYGFSLLVPLWNDGIQLSTWRRANALAHDDGMFTLWTTPDLMGKKCIYVCMSRGERSLRPICEASHKNCRVPKMSTWWDHLNVILPHVCAIQVCIYVDGGSYDDPKIDWLEADPFKWSVIIDLVWNRCCSVGYLW